MIIYISYSGTTYSTLYVTCTRRPAAMMMWALQHHFATATIVIALCQFRGMHVFYNKTKGIAERQVLCECDEKRKKCPPPQHTLGSLHTVDEYRAPCPLNSIAWRASGQGFSIQISIDVQQREICVDRCLHVLLLLLAGARLLVAGASAGRVIAQYVIGATCYWTTTAAAALLLHTLAVGTV